MEYYSTSGKAPNVGLRDAVLSGMAPDGGLYMPSRIPVLPMAFFNNMADMTLAETTYVVANTLFSDEVDSAILSKIAADTFSFDLPMRRLTPDVAALELFHGPTGSFNDIGARFLAGLLPHLRPDTVRPVNFLMATTGDSGAAVAAALHDMPGAKVTILFPARRLSELRLAKIASYGGNITAIEVNDTIATCVSMVDNVFASRELVEQARLSPGGSVNIARFLPQIFYYFHAYARLRADADKRRVVVALPGGNLGNLASGLMAKRMGLPIDRFIVLKNVESPTNYPRITALYGGDLEALRRDVTVIDAMECTPTWSILQDNIDPATETGIFFQTVAPETPEAASLSEADKRLIRLPHRPLKIGRSMAALKNFLLTNI